MDDNLANMKNPKGKEQLIGKAQDSLDKINDLIIEIEKELSEEGLDSNDQIYLAYEKLSDKTRKRDQLKLKIIEKKEREKVLLEGLKMVQDSYDTFSEEEKNLTVNFLREQNNSSLKENITKESLEEEIKERLATLKKEIESESEELDSQDREIKNKRDEIKKKERLSLEMKLKRDNEYEKKKKIIREELMKIESLEKDMKVVTFNETSKKQIDDIRKFLSDKS